MTVAAVLGDVVRRHLHPASIDWRLLQPSERDRWVAVGDAVLARIWELDT